MDVVETKYIAYYRVSTQQQGKSGLGLEAQQSVVESYCKGNIIASFTDIESGKRNDNRPELTKAIDMCISSNAVLIIAKLDRLSRNSAFIGRLMESKVQFKCCDMPEADSFTIHIFAALAQKEREMISQRTKIALKALKERGVKLGNPAMANPEYKEAHLTKARNNRGIKDIPIAVAFIITQLKDKSLHIIAGELNKQGHKTMHNKPYSATQVFRLKRKLFVTN